MKLKVNLEKVDSSSNSAITIFALDTNAEIKPIEAKVEKSKDEEKTTTSTTEKQESEKKIEKALRRHYPTF